MINKGQLWEDVPQDKYSEWSRIFYQSQEGINLSSPCPVCNNQTLHCYYHASRQEERIIDGRRYIARGSLWQWCSSCRSYIHYSAAVPEWWTCNLTIDCSRLTHSPDILEEAIQNSN